MLLMSVIKYGSLYQSLSFVHNSLLLQNGILVLKTKTFEYSGTKATEIIEYINNTYKE